MAESSYGFQIESRELSNVDAYLEDIRIQGYTVIESLFDKKTINEIRSKVYSIYQEQELSFGKDELDRISDTNICRCPMAHDISFAEYASNNLFMHISEYFLDNYFILNVQNANISKPNLKHVQSAWHRDLPYQNFTSSRPLGVNFLVVIDDFTIENGGIVVLPFSHKLEAAPSQQYIENNQKIITAKSGDVISFDSMLMHRAGVNKSMSDRCSFNHMYTRPFIKQQYDYSIIMQDIARNNKLLYQLSGVSSRTALDGTEWRNNRRNKLSHAVEKFS